MAFTEEQEQQILDTVAKFGEFLQKQQETKKETQDNLGDNAKNDTKEKADAKELQENLEKALGFNMKIGKFTEDFKTVLPESSKSIIELANKKTYTSAVEKANDIRRALIDAYLEKQSNIDSLPESMRLKVEQYKALAEDTKTLKSSSFWDIVEVGAEMQNSKKRAEALNKANGYTNNGDESAHRQRWFSQGEKWKKGK